MAFGKKKSHLPPVKGARPVVSQKTVYRARQEPNLDEMKSVSVFEAGRLLAGLCEARGYPADALPSIALNTMWLESRGIPALGSMAKDLFEHWKEDLRERGPKQDAHGRGIMPCPLFASAFTGGMIQQLVDAGPGKKADFICGGPVQLLLPRIADHSRTHKVAVQMEIHPVDRYVDNPTSFIVHEDEFAAHGFTTSLSGPANVLLRIYPDNMLPARTAFSSHQPKVTTIRAQVMLLELIEGYRKGAGFTGSLPFEQGLALESDTRQPPQPLGLSPLSPTTRDFFKRTIDTDTVLTQTFSAITKGNRSGLSLIVFGSADGQDHSNTVLMTTNLSETGVFYKHCEKLGWMMSVEDPARVHESLVSYRVTKTGRMGLSVLLTER